MGWRRQEKIPAGGFEVWWEEKEEAWRATVVRGERGVVTKKLLVSRSQIGLLETKAKHSRCVFLRLAELIPVGAGGRLTKGSLSLGDSVRPECRLPALPLILLPKSMTQSSPGLPR